IHVNRADRCDLRLELGVRAMKPALHAMRAHAMALQDPPDLRATDDHTELPLDRLLQRRQRPNDAESSPTVLGPLARNPDYPSSLLGGQLWRAAAALRVAQAGQLRALREARTPFAHSCLGDG